MTDAVSALLADPGSALIAIDFDGTLAPIVERPEDALPAAGARDVLIVLAERLGGVAIISGRSAAEVVALAGVADVRALRVLGHYGLQQWSAGSLATPPPTPGVTQAKRRLPDLLTNVDPGVAVEDKGLSVAVHTRRAAEPAAELERLAPILIRLAEETGLEAVPGRYVIELRPTGVDKGTALRQLISDTAASTVIYLGDDLGDLPAYDVVDELTAAGTVIGLTVACGDPADGDAPPEVAERAGMSLDGPAAVVAWLAGLAAMLG